MHMRCMSLNNFLHSSVPQFAPAGNGAEPCAGGVSCHPNCHQEQCRLCLRAELRHTRGHELGHAPLHLQNLSLRPGGDRPSPKGPLTYQVGKSQSLSPQKVPAAVGQSNSGFTRVSWAINNGQLVILVPETVCLRCMRSNSLGLL